MVYRVVLATASYDRTICLWEAPSGVCYRTIQFQDSHINALAVSRDKTLLAAAGHTVVRMFDLQNPSPAPAISLEGHAGNIVALGFPRDARWCWTASEDATLRVWDLRSRTCTRKYKCEAPISGACMHPNDAQIVTSDHSGKLSVWDLVADKCSLELLPERASGAPLADVAVSSNGQYMVALGNSGMLYKYTMAQASSAVKGVLGEPQSVKAHDRYGLSVTISPDSKLIATTSADHSIKLWGAADLALERTLTGHSKWVWRSVFSADSAYLVSCSSDASARLWDVSTGDCVRSYVGHQKPCVALAMNDE